MKIHFSAGAWTEVDLAATPREFAWLADGIRQLVVTGVGEWIATADTGIRDQTLGKLLSELRVRMGVGPLVLTVEGGTTLLACGGPEALELFAANLQVLDTEPSLPPNYHIHFERAGREQFVSIESVPLVLRVVGGKDA
jgi:hypothetical protein